MLPSMSLQHTQETKNKFGLNLKGLRCQNREFVTRVLRVAGTLHYKRTVTVYTKYCLVQRLYTFHFRTLTYYNSSSSLVIKLALYTIKNV
jgi:hypothetical protein